MSPPSKRQRDVEVLPFVKGRFDHYLDNQPNYKGTGTGGVGPVIGRQITVSEGHPFQTISRGRFVEDIGGEFFTQRQYMSKSVGFASVDASRNGERVVYAGPCVALPDGFSNSMGGLFPPSLHSSDAALNAAGATAIARCKPTNSVADVSVALGELMKDGLPSLVGSSLWRDKTKSALGKGSDEFLNVEFGWKPMISDVKKFAKAIKSADAVIAQYERDAGRMVRRRYNFPVERKDTHSVWVSGVKPMVSPRHLTTLWALPTGTIYRLREFSQRRWFSGAFTYAMPTQGNSSREGLASFARHADKVYGVSLTPETLWNLAPWSWAADWVTNMGDVVSNVSDWSLHGLVLRYGYIMEHTVVRDTYTMEITGANPHKVFPSSVSFVTETKIRKRASPFGFGITWEGLSPLQLAILAAVGISRKQ